MAEWIVSDKKSPLGYEYLDIVRRKELIMCKDCIHKNGLNHCPHNNDIWVADDWYCADGVKKYAEM